MLRDREVEMRKRTGNRVNKEESKRVWGENRLTTKMRKPLSKTEKKETISHWKM